MTYLPILLASAVATQKQPARTSPVKTAATLAAFAIIGAMLGSQSREGTPPPADSDPRKGVVTSGGPLPSVEEAAGPGTPAPLEEPSVWYSSYDAAGKVALETGRPLIVAITEEKPEFEPTSEVAFCWLHLAEVGPEWDRFNPPCVLRCDRVTDSEPPKFDPITLEDL